MRVQSVGSFSLAAGNQSGSHFSLAAGEREHLAAAEQKGNSYFFLLNYAWGNGSSA